MSLTYLAGPIAGCSDEECIQWREEVEKEIDCLNPMIRDFRYSNRHFSRHVVEPDKEDIDKCSYVLVNANKPSWGTAMEVMYAFIKKKPVFAFVESDDEISPWLLYHAVIFPSMGKAVEAIKTRIKNSK